jgi:nicotinamidase-related amidase
MNEALIVIDVQEGFFSDPGNPVYNENILINNINQLIDSFRKDGKTIIFVRHIDDDLIKGTRHWEIYSKVHSKSDDLYIDKTTPDSFFETELLHVLKTNNINSIVIAGLQTEYCIDTTCKSTFGKGIPTILVSDGHSTYDNSFMKADKIIEYHHAIIGRWFARLKTTDEILNNNR